jgi:hypothetical protein
VFKRNDRKLKDYLHKDKNEVAVIEEKSIDLDMSPDKFGIPFHVQTSEEHCRHHKSTPNLNETKGLIEIKMDFSLTKLPCHESKISAFERGERQMLWVG